MRVIPCAIVGVAFAFSGVNAIAADDAAVERGRYLAAAGDCVGCHTALGQAPLAGGRPIETPFGIVESSNITPDRDTGIGGWSDDAFVRAVQRGIGIHGHLYPAMPYPYFATATRDDVLAIFAYLKTLPPMHNQVAENRLRFPFNQRWLMIGWNLLFFHTETFRPVADKSAVWNRGAYLVEGLGHCGACHTPKNAEGADERGGALQGATLQDWYASNLSEDSRTGLGAWAPEDIVSYLASGHTARADAAGPMVEVIENSTSHLNPSDLGAIAGYLKGLPAHGAPSQPPLSPGNPLMRSGQALYVNNCADCHGDFGEGAGGMPGPFAGSATAQADDPTSLIRIVLEGAHGTKTASGSAAPAMPAFAATLTDEQIAAVLSYVRNAWKNAASTVTAASVAGLRLKLGAAKVSLPEKP